MKRYQLLKVAALLLLCYAMQGCIKLEYSEQDTVEPEPEVTDQAITVYGTVFNKVTHEPVSGVEVEIGQNWSSSVLQYYGSSACHKITSSISGYDGQFEMQFGELDFYEDFYIGASCDGYKNYYSKISIGEGGDYRMDINLEPK